MGLIYADEPGAAVHPYPLERPDGLFDMSMTKLHRGPLLLLLSAPKLGKL